ncbi:hypothetical protein C0J52_05356 [Blattella germanica]|nr:hypothetical protein C0J52_05356 [Blattella germanica]
MGEVNTSALIKASATSAPNPFSKMSSKAPFKLSGKFEKRPCSEISFKDFLDFLRTAYQINEAIDGVPEDLIDKVEIDWHDVAMNEFVSSLLAVKDENSKTKVMGKMDSKSGTDISCSDMTESSENTLKSEQSIEIRSAVSELTESSDISKSISTLSSEKDLRKDNIPVRDVELKNKVEPIKENLFHELKRPQGPALPDPSKQRSLQIAKISENKKKIFPNKKDVLIECKGRKANEENSKNLEHLMKRKLNEVIQEGLLDSVLPYVVPKQPAPHVGTKKSSSSETKKPPSLTSLDKSSSSQFSKEKLSINNRRKSSSGEIEVEIHVCDEVKNLKRDFRCPQKLLVSKMGYFAEVTTGNVVPILVSAAFLQMDPLLQDCLQFCRQHMNEIAKTSTNLACLNDSILTRLANLFSNSEVEALKDKKDKIQSRLYCKLIMALTETSPEPARGHFASLASVYRCGKCDKLILRQLGGNIPCKPCNMKMDSYGNIHGNHIRDQNWNLNDYIRNLRQELKSWRFVYWRLWGDCHFLYCNVCHNYFPVHQMKWCCHHPELAQFFTMEHQRAMTFPIGRFPCCGDRAYRFEVLNSQSGCQFKEHTPSLNTPRDIEVNKLFIKHQSLITMDPPKLQCHSERLTRLVSRESGRGENVNREALWWEGLELAPPRPRQGLLAKMWESHQKKEQQRQSVAPSRNNSSASSGTNSTLNRTVTPCVRAPIKKQMSMNDISTNNTGSNADADNSSSNDDSSSSTSSSDTENSEESSHAPVRRVTAKPRRIEAQFFTPSKNKVEASNQWLTKLSVRSNQDNQREYEERAGRQMASILTRRTCADSSSLYARAHNRGHHAHHSHSIWNNHIIPQGGVYVRLEQEWRENNCHTHGCHGNSNRQRTSGWGGSSRPRVRAPR